MLPCLLHVASAGAGRSPAVGGHDRVRRSDAMYGSSETVCHLSVVPSPA